MGDYAEYALQYFWRKPFKEFKQKRKQRKITCKYCNEKNLHWVNTKSGWRLYTQDNKLHKCNKDNKNENKCTERTKS